MKLRIIGFLMALVLVLIPVSSVAAGTTADVTVNATPAFVSISVNVSTYTFGVVAVSTNYSTGQGQFNITNASTVQTDQTISVTGTTWTGGTPWAHAEDGVSGSDIVALYASNNTGVFNIIVKNGTPNYIYENKAAGGSYLFELRMKTPTVFSDGVVKANTVRVSAAVG